MPIPRTGYAALMHVFEAAAEAFRLGQPAALATVIAKGGSAPRSSGARMLVRADGSTCGTIGGGAVEWEVMQAAQRVIRLQRAERYIVHLTRDLGMCCGGEMEFYIEPLEVRSPFYLFGAGHVAHALAPLLHALDFAVHVIDSRPEYATDQRFPSCTLHVDDPVEFVRENPLPDCAWVLVTTHDHAMDQALCEEILRLPTAWIGMIGSRAKVTKFLLRLRRAGVPEDDLQRLRAPVGLDIGAETPAEIAVAIAAELVQVRRLRANPKDPAPLSTTRTR
jgi:xanthine dehydrogenase accessory factor